jgi:Trehalase
MNAQHSNIDLQKQAQAVLQLNWRDGYTIPSARLYPFQWNWDAGFIALGWSYTNMGYAMAEIDNMFKGQWENGMLPHINFFKPDDNYFPGAQVWQTDNLPHGPKHIATSGITQPPVFGFIVQRMHDFQSSHSAEWKAFLKNIFPKIVAFHRYLYTHRDPLNEGLVYIQHNWESGTDNSPVWDDILEGMDISNARDVAALRRDNKNVDAAERPTDENYKRYISLVDLFAKLQYDDAAIAATSPFLVQDVLFNSMLVKSNEGLIAIARYLGEDDTAIVQWNEKTKAAINSKLWNEEAGFYFAYDLRNERSIPIKTSSGFMPLFAGVATAQHAAKVVDHLATSFSPNERWKLCISTAANEAAFNPVKYWRGPVWINLNWMLYHGLLRYGQQELAGRLKADTLYLVEQHGFYEYFDGRPAGISLAERGIGADLFSWSAALYLDLLNNPQPL